MFLNVDQLEKQLDNKEFQEIGSMASFKKEYTRLDIPEFRDTLIQNMDYVKKSIEKRALHKMEYDSRVNERLMQTTEEKVDSSKALDASLVIIESNGTESQKQDTSSRSGNDAHVNDADIRPIYNEEPMAEVQMTADDNVSATGQQHTEQPEFINEGEVDQNAEQCHEICPLPAKLTDDKTTELSNQSLESENVCLKKTVAQCQQDFAKLEAHCTDIKEMNKNKGKADKTEHGNKKSTKKKKPRMPSDFIGPTRDPLSGGPRAPPSQFATKFPIADDDETMTIPLPTTPVLPTKEPVNSLRYEFSILIEIIDHIEEKSSGSTTTHADFSKYDSFIFNISINSFPPADRSDFYHEEFVDELAHIISPPEYDHFCFKFEPELGNLTMDVDCSDSEASRAQGFVLRSQELHILIFILGNPIS
ncbi:hypothetical protein Tco_0542470 [Tanacetum coccineum]